MRIGSPGLLSFSRGGRPMLRTYSVNAKKRAPIVNFMLEALRESGCQIVEAPDPSIAPFRILFDTPEGERMGVVAYAFTANSKKTKNRPADEHRFQVKYGNKDKDDDGEHEVWQDPNGLYTTIFCGINAKKGFFVGADPVLHSPTKFFISVEFREAHARRILETGWFAWERARRSGEGKARLKNPDKPADLDKAAGPVEVLVGGTKKSFLRYIRFEREARGESQGERQLLAERPQSSLVLPPASLLATPPEHVLVALAGEFGLPPEEILALISKTARLRMAVRGFVAEEHLVSALKHVPGVTDCKRPNVEGGPDVTLTFGGKRGIKVECKNAMKKMTAEVPQRARVDLQRTRTSKKDPCSRFYTTDAFDVVAACLHATTGDWKQFRFARAVELDPHKKCVEPPRLSNNVKVNFEEKAGLPWTSDAARVLRAVASA